MLPASMCRFFSTLRLYAKFYVAHGIQFTIHVAMIPSEYVHKPRLRPEPSPSPGGSRLKARASISASPGSQKPSLSPGFQAEPGPHITTVAIRWQRRKALSMHGCRGGTGQSDTCEMIPMTRFVIEHLICPCLHTRPKRREQLKIQQDKTY